ncbi:CCPG1 isoform 12, partial [Pan troglodytes]
TDFVNDVKDYLRNMKEYEVDNDGVFEKLDEYIYRHFFGHTFSPPYGPSRPDKKQRMVNIENSRHRKQEQKHLQPQPYKREDGVLLCRPGWSAVARSRLTASSASRVHAILPQPPE